MITVRCLENNKVTVMYEVTNTSLATAVNVIVKFTITNKLFYYNHSLNKGVFNSSYMQWNVGNLLPSESQFISIDLINTSITFDSEHTIEAVASADNTPQAQDTDILKFNCTENINSYISDDDFTYISETNKYYTWDLNI